MDGARCEVELGKTSVLELSAAFVTLESGPCISRKPPSSNLALPRYINIAETRHQRHAMFVHAISLDDMRTTDSRSLQPTSTKDPRPKP